MSGKLKMVLQCLAAGTSLFALAGWASTAAGTPVWLDYLLMITVWGAILLTIYSGIEYVRRAVALWRE